MTLPFFLKVHKRGDFTSFSPMVYVLWMKITMKILLITTPSPICTWLYILLFIAISVTLSDKKSKDNHSCFLWGKAELVIQLTLVEQNLPLGKPVTFFFLKAFTCPHTVPCSTSHLVKIIFDFYSYDRLLTGLPYPQSILQTVAGGFSKCKSDCFTYLLKILSSSSFPTR